MKTSARCITQFSKTTIDPNAVELAAGVFRTYLINLRERRGVSRGRAGLLFSMAWAHSPQSGFHAAYSARRSGAGQRGTPAKLAQFFRFREGGAATTGRARARGVDGALPGRLPASRDRRRRGRAGEPGAKSRRLAKKHEIVI